MFAIETNFDRAANLLHEQQDVWTALQSAMTDFLSEMSLSVEHLRRARGGNFG